jgi:hypothetical protein
LAQLSAEPGSFKTFFVLGTACAVASDKDNWLGYEVAYHCPVLYVAAEGANGMHSRVLAWCQSEQVDPDSLDLTFYPEAVQLNSYAQMEELEKNARLYNFGLIILDTRARCTLGLEENSATEQGIAIAAAEKLRYATGATVLVIHHSARAGAGAASAGRGSNAWDGAVWTDLRSKRKGMNLTVTCAKHKDVESGCAHEFSLLPIVLPDGRTTLVVGRPGEFVPERKPVNTAELLEIVRVVAELAPREGMRASAIVEASGLPRATVNRRIKQAKEQGMLKEIGKGTISMYAVNPEYSDPDHE